MSKLNPQKASAYVGPGVLRKGGKITPVPNGPLIKKKGPYAGSTLKSGGVIKKAANGTTTTQTTIKPNYSKIRGGGLNYFKTPTAKDSSDYRKGFDKKVKGEELKQYNKGDKKLFPSPSSSEIRGYNEASERVKKSIPKKKAGGMIKRADGSYSKRGLWDNIRANKGSGKKPTAAMLKQERKIKAKSKK